MAADGQEVLVVDVDDKVRRGLDSLLRGAGLLPTLVADAARAVELSREKFFAVALLDLDTPAPGEGVPLIGEVAAASPATTVLTMSSRKSYELAVRAFRAGAADVITKAPDQVPYLRDRVLNAATDKRRQADTSLLLADALALHEELMRVLVETHRRAGELQEKVTGDAGPSDEETHVLVVDEDGWLESQLGAMMLESRGYRFKAVSTGGEALDLTGRQRFQIALVRDTLPDLPGSMVVRTLKSQVPETIVLLYTAPSDTQAGSVGVFQDSGLIPFVKQFSDAGQIMERIDELRDAFRATSRERRMLANFRQQNFELLKRYAELRHKMRRLLGEESGARGLRKEPSGLIPSGVTAPPPPPKT